MSIFVVCIFVFFSSGGSLASEDFAPGFLSPSPEDDDDPRLDLDLDAMETPSDSESLHFPNYDLDLEGERSEGEAHLQEALFLILDPVGLLSFR